VDPAQSQSAASYLIRQDWSEYSFQDHSTWSELVSRRMPQLREHACHEYLQGITEIGLREDVIPDLQVINSRLRTLTG
jgi:phenylalanine-4-hydroxylase